MKNVLVTGANGQLGTCLSELIVSNSHNFYFKKSNELDITNELELDVFFKKISLDYCINCAAYTNVEKAEIDQKNAFSINEKGVKNLTKQCLKHNVTLIHISTDYVFDGNKKLPYLITDKTNPINIYGKSKLAGEHIIRHKLNKNYFIIRTSWLYSKTTEANFYTIISKKLKSGNTLSVIDNQTGCPTDARNLANYIINLITTNATNYGIHHFCGDIPMTWYEFAIAIKYELNSSTIIKPVNSSAFKTNAKRPAYSVLEKFPK